MHSTPSDRPGYLAYRLEDLESLAQALVTRAGLAPDKVACVTRTLIEGDLLGHDTHGLALLPGYLKELESGSMAGSGSFEVLSDKPAAVLWDGHRLPGPWLVEQGLEMLMPRARELGVASLAIKRSHHIACLAVYLMRAAREGFVMVLASSDPNIASVAPFGGTRAVFTPNPLAIGFPCSSGDVLIDISASITTNGMSNRKAQAGQQFAHPWFIDAQGEPTTDPAVLSQTPPGTILPIGGLSYGHKGYGLALMVEALTGGLAGWGRADPKEGWGATVHITLYDIEAFAGRTHFLRQMDEIAQQCLTNPPRPGTTSVRLPGQAGLQRRAEQQRNGIRLHPDVVNGLLPVCERYGLPFPASMA
jgi:LDH2 family malate/lactate/ureidoglycolate dehydrogenase